MDKSGRHVTQSSSYHITLLDQVKVMSHVGHFGVTIPSQSLTEKANMHQ